MGWLFNLLTLPVSAPIGGVIWIADTILEQAENELYDVDSIRAAMTALELRYDLGTMTEDEFYAAEEVLLARLRVAAEREQARRGAPAADGTHAADGAHDAAYEDGGQQ